MTESEVNMSALEKIKASDKPVITPAEAASVLCCNPQYIRLQARKDASKLPFPVFCVGSRTHIPRLPFIAFIEGGAYGW